MPHKQSCQILAKTLVISLCWMSQKRRQCRSECESRLSSIADLRHRTSCSSAGSCCLEEPSSGRTGRKQAHCGRVSGKAGPPCSADSERLRADTDYSRVASAEFMHVRRPLQLLICVGRAETDSRLPSAAISRPAYHSWSGRKSDVSWFPSSIGTKYGVTSLSTVLRQTQRSFRACGP